MTEKTETLEKVSQRIVLEWADQYQVIEAGPATLARLAAVVLSALRNERERCAKLLEARAAELQAEWDAPPSTPRLRVHDYHCR